MCWGSCGITTGSGKFSLCGLRLRGQLPRLAPRLRALECQACEVGLTQVLGTPGVTVGLLEELGIERGAGRCGAR